jgi:hypothetical protein
MHEVVMAVAALVAGWFVMPVLVWGILALFPHLKISIVGFVFAVALSVFVCGSLGICTNRAVAGILVGYAIPLFTLLLSGIRTTFRKVPQQPA